MICVHCGKEIDNGQAFCPYCGSRVGGDAAPEAKAAKKDPRKLALPAAAGRFPSRTAPPLPLTAR